MAETRVTSNAGTSASSMSKNRNILPRGNGTTRKPFRRSGRHQSNEWRPPPFFKSIAEEEERQDEVVKETAMKSARIPDIIEVRSNDTTKYDTALKTSYMSSAKDFVGMEDSTKASSDDNQTRTQKNIVEIFRPFRKDIAQYITNTLKSHDCGDSMGFCKARVEESTIQVLIAAMEDESLYHDSNFPKMEALQSSIHERDVMSFWEGVRISVSASTRLHSILRQKQPTDTDPLTPPYIAQTPRKFRSIRVASVSGNGHQYEVDRVDEKRNDSVLWRLGEKTQKAQSLRAMSIARAANNQWDKTNKDAQEIKKLLKELGEAEKYQHRLEQQLKKAGIVIAEDIPYDLAKFNVAEIAGKMSDIHDKSHDTSTSEETKSEMEAEYFKLEQEMEKYIAALELTDEWIEEQSKEEQKWEETMEADNRTALKMVLRHMPVDVRNRSELQLRENPTPNGDYLPRSIAQRFKRTNCLQLLRTDPAEMIAWHPSMFENLRVTGLTLTERRALHQHLKPIGIRWKDQSSGSGDKMLERKLVWFETLKSNFRESLCAYERHIAMYGPPGNHPYASSSPESKGCPLIGRQCPLRADKAVDYSGNYGYPEDSVYFKQTDGNPVAENRIKGCDEGTQSSDRRVMGEIKCRGRDGRAPGRGGLLNEIKGRCSSQDRIVGGRGHTQGGRGGGGRGGLLAAIQARRSD